MKFVRISLSAVLLSAVIASDASAMPFAAGAAAAYPAPILVRNGYGPLRYGLYGHHHRHYRRAYGHHGRGTRTGGPAGGLPGRS